MRKIISFVVSHKILTGIILAALIFAGYSGYKRIKLGDSGVRYVLAAVQKGTLTLSVSGTGQVVASNQVDVKSKVSGDIIRIGVKQGQNVQSSAFLVQIDAKDAEKTVRDAETNLESAKLSLEKLKKPADSLALLQAENNLSSAYESRQKAEDDLKKSYEDGFNSISNAFLDLSSVLSGLEDVFFEVNIQSNQANISWYLNQASLDVEIERDKATRYMNDLQKTYDLARDVYAKNFESYKSSSRNSGNQTVESLISETYETAKVVADTVKTGNNYIDFVENTLKQRDASVPAIITTHQSKLDSYTSLTNQTLSNLLAAKNSIERGKEAITNADRSISEKSESLTKIKSGADELDLQSAGLSVRQRENALQDAREKLNDYVIRAPFNGSVAKIDWKVGDSISLNSVIATMTTKDQLAEVTLNEIDAAKVAVGQKAELTFDAIPDLTISGEVEELDTLGTMSQGIVSYTAKINLDKSDPRIKPGMTVSAFIITETKDDVLIVPNSAVKTFNDSHFVEISDDQKIKSKTPANLVGIVLPEEPSRKAVDVGISNDDFTEVTSGLEEGDLVIVNKLNSAPNGSNGNIRTGSGPANTFRFPGQPGGGNRTFRINR